MKHIFTVHSPITFFLTWCIIQYKNINFEDIVILSFGYKIPLRIGKSQLDFYQLEKGVLNKFLNPNLPKFLDKIINKYTNGQDFIAYIDLMHNYQKIIITHNKCREFSFMEEGTASYIIPDSLAFITRTSKNIGFRSVKISDYKELLVKLVRSYNSRLLSVPHHPQAYAAFPTTKFYTLSSDAYPHVANGSRVVVTPEDYNLKEYFCESNFQIRPNDVIWLEETFCRNNGYTADEYKVVIEKAIRSPLFKNVNSINLKLKPRQNLSDSMVYKVLIANGLSVNIVSNHHPLEFLLVATEGLKVVGIVSSLLFYAELFGHDAYSIYPLFDQKKGLHKFSNWSFYWKKVKLLNL